MQKNSATQFKAWKVKYRQNYSDWSLYKSALDNRLIVISQLVLLMFMVKSFVVRPVFLY